MKTDGHDNPPKLTEPEALPSLFVTGHNIQVVEPSIVLVIFWTDLPPIGDLQREARVQARIAMSEKTFRRLVNDGRKIGRNKQ